MNIKKLTLKNFQVIKDFESDFNGNVYFLKGDNEVGKSTLLKAICALLTGERDNVLSIGEDKGFAKMIVGNDGEEYEVSLSFTKANPRGNLQIKHKATGMATDNLSMLQKIFGYSNFDAVEFVRWSDTAEGRRKQVEVIKGFLPENVKNRIAQIDEKTVKIKAERKELNADYKALKTIAENAGKQLTPSDIDNCTEPKDITSLLVIQSERTQLEYKAKEVAKKKEQRENELAAIPNGIEAAKTKTIAAETAAKIDRQKAVDTETSEIAEANAAYELAVSEAAAKRDKAIEAANQKCVKTIETIETNVKMAKENEAFEIAAIEAKKADSEQRLQNAIKWLAEFEKQRSEWEEIKVSELQEYNDKCKLVADYKAKKELADQKKALIDEKEITLKSLAAERETLVNSANLPIQGLTFGEDGLLLNGIPFAQGKTSDSQNMEVAVRLAIAANQKTKVFCIARGESLGSKRLNEIIRIAKDNGFQGFIEEVQRGQENLSVEEYTE